MHVDVFEEVDFSSVGCPSSVYQIAVHFSHFAILSRVIEGPYFCHRASCCGSRTALKYELRERGIISQRPVETEGALMSLLAGVIETHVIVRGNLLLLLSQASKTV